MPNSINQTLPGAPNGVVDSAQAPSPRNAIAANSLVATPGDTVDRATVSQLGQALDSASRSAGRLSSFRPALVAQFREAIANGSYRPDLTQVAARVAQALSSDAGSR